MRIAVCLFVRNEERDIAEWIVYHSIVGFETFIIYDNGSNDRTGEVVDRLRRIYNIKMIDWPRATKYSQLEAYDDCLKNFRDDFDWIAFIDSDEFVAPVRDGSVGNFLAHFEGVNAIALNWSVFGSAGHVELPPGLNIESFTRRASNEVGVNLHVKMIVRPNSANRVNGPHYISVDRNLAQKADGTTLVMRSHGESQDTAGFDICRLNHYFVRSRAHWNAKLRRGYREGHRPADQFEAHDLNDVEDLWVAGYAPRIKATLGSINLLPLRSARPLDPIAANEEEKQSAEWLAVRPTLDDVMFCFPDYAREKGNALFDSDFYLATYSDVRASGMDPFLHYTTSGFAEGRRPCSREALMAYLRGH